MPTYQTAPLLAPVFPTLVRNPYGFQPLKGNTLKHADLPAAGESFQPSWKREADFAALARVENNKIKEKDMLKGPISIKSNIPFTTFRGPQGHAISGGTVWTSAAEKTIQGLLRDRKFQLDAIDQASFDTVAPERVKQAEPVTETYSLDKLFSELYSTVDSAVITPALLGTASTIVNFFLTKSDTIPDHKFAEYGEILTKLNELIDEVDNRSKFQYKNSNEYKRIKSVLNDLNATVINLNTFITEYMGYLGEPTKRKTARLSAIRNRLLKYSYAPPEVTGYVEPSTDRGTIGSVPSEYVEAVRNPPVADEVEARPADFGAGFRRRF
jgi:hypothetical protein